MWKGAISGRIGRGRLLTIVAAAAIVGGAAAWQRPWADSVMTAVVSLSTDEQGVVSTRQVRRLFRAGGDAGAASVVELGMREWEGERVLVEVRGSVARRGVKEGMTGYAACAMEVVEATGERPVEFVGWQHGGEMNVHVGPVGSPAYRLEGSEEGRNPPFVYSMKGGLRHVVEVPRGARLRVSLRPVMSEDVPARPEPFVPEMRRQGRVVIERRQGRVVIERQQGQVVIDRPQEGSTRQPDVFIYVIDALRPDHLGCYGYERGTSPAIDAFAAGATQYMEALTPTTWTRPSVATLLTGLYPSVHGAMHNSDGLAEWPVLLPEVLQEAGYGTLCVTANPHIDEAFGFKQGYERFVMRRAGTAGWVRSQAESFLAGRGGEEPVFMYLHTMEPHDPYRPRPESRRRFDRGIGGECDGSVEGLTAAGRVNPKLSAENIAHLVDLYDAEVFDADRGFAEFVQMLKRSGRLDNALVILTADHGEAFGEHDTMSHGRNLNVEEMHVPLIVRFPGGRDGGTQVEERVGLHDLVPTVLAEVGARPKLSYALPGRELPGASSAPKAGRSRRFYAELSQFGGNEIDLVGVIDEDGFKRVIDLSAAPRETAARKSLGLWDTGADPGEEREVSGRLPVRAAYDEQLIAQWLLEQRQVRQGLTGAPAPRVQISDELEKQLRSLGYLQGTKSAGEAARGERK
ncbi:MAG TPA: sulfatase [Armatimonadota bacterium]|nr:sulfatase [Armatimonadota bacterium]